MNTSCSTILRVTILCVWFPVSVQFSVYADTQHFQFTSNTGNNATVIVPVDASPSVNGVPLVPDDEIGVFTREGLCVGAARWTGSNIAITIWGNNDQTEQKDGLAPGDSLYYRVWLHDTDIEYPNIEVTYSVAPPATNSSGRYSVDAIYILTSLGTFPEPGPPELLSPSNNASDLPVSLTLEWQGDQRTDSFNLQIAHDTDFSDIVFDQHDITEDFYEISGLEYQSDYYWRVSGTNLAGTGDWSDVWRFSTLDRFIQFENPAQSTVWVENSIQQISWIKLGVDVIRVEYSVDNGSQWQTVEESVDAGAGEYEWTVPSTPSTEALLRLTDIQHEDTYTISAVFSIYPLEIQIDHSMEFGNPSMVTSYRMIGLPGDIDIPLSSVLSGTAGSDWIAFYDDGSDEEYLIEYDGTNRFNIRPGKGFWVLSRNGLAYQSNRSSVELNPENAYEIPLHSGWNIIANPFGVPIPWGSVQALNGILTPIWGYAGSFSQSNTLRPYDGYYFYNDENLSSLAIPYPNSGAPPAPESPHPALKHRLTLSIDRDGNRLSDIVIGLTGKQKKHTQGYIFKAPPSDFEEASIRLHNDDVHTVVNNTLGGGYTYDITIRLPKNQTYTLVVDGAETFDDYELTLVHRRTGKTAGLHHQNSFQVASPSGLERYKIIIGNERYTSEALGRLMPEELTLSQNYPNPFNPATTIEYSLPVQKDNSLVTLEIYNVLGQKVRTLVNENQSAGFYTVVWNARDDRGMTVPSGLYIYRLGTGTTVHSKRMLLLK